MQVCILTMILTYRFCISTQYDRELVKASKSTTGCMRRRLKTTRWSVNALLPRNIRL